MSISRVYFAIALEDARYGSTTFGKMKQPWHNVTDLIQDADMNLKILPMPIQARPRAPVSRGGIGWHLVATSLESGYSRRG